MKKGRVLTTLRKLPPKLPVTHLTGVLIDDEDLPITEGWAWSMLTSGYVAGIRTVAPKKRVRTTLHRLILGYPDSTVDHINGNKLDNRRGNLRLADQQLQQINRHHLSRNNRSGYRGIRDHGSFWSAEIWSHRNRIYLGSFKSIEEAVTARRKAELRFWGMNSP